ncbi:hypothetical protein G7Y89_g2670 [Cudoniella acicularis]|uniref:Plasmid pRiA4b Orf3-like domain-containing protein n=1 Tax=Cudoniella acicularis TaxID=354080 RepID=A0A8H4W5X3_9HELO|nr:hypothetical protein G7Y89_g2670 [Cudoniella acicularis]
MTHREVVRVGLADMDRIRAAGTENSIFDQPKCGLCNIIQTEERKLLQCGRCKQTKYCTLQIAFGSASTHTYDFKIKDPNAEPEPEFNLMSYISRKAAQDAARFSGGQFQMLDPVRTSFESMRTTQIDNQKIKLSKVLDNKKYEEAGIEYGYDFGDHWAHQIKVIGRSNATGRFQCLDGESHGFAEDVGGVKGWLKLREAYKTTTPNKEQKEKRKWFENVASNGDPKGLGNGRDRLWDKASINRS